MTDRSPRRHPCGSQPNHESRHGSRPEPILSASLGPAKKILTAKSDEHSHGFHPILAFADHGTAGTGAPLAAILRPGNAGSNTATDHIAVTELALAQLDSRQQGRVLIRADSAGGTKAFTQYLADKNLAYSVGFSGFLAHLKTAIDTLQPGA